MKKMKQERRRDSNPFQKLQNKRNFWLMSHPAKMASLGHRLSGKRTRGHSEPGDRRGWQPGGV